MKYYSQAIKLALKEYRWSIAASTLCSLMIGLLWGANLGAVYPFVEIIFRGESLESWVQTEIENAESEIDRLSVQIVEKQQRLPQNHEPQKLLNSISVDQRAIDSWKSRLGWLIRAQPTIRNYAPKSGFGTLALLVVFIMVATFLKCVLLLISMHLIARMSLGINRDLKHRFFDKYLDLRLGVSNHNSLGDSMSKIGHDINSIGSSLNILFGKSVREPIKMFACLAGAMYLNWRLLAMSLIVTPIAFGLLYILSYTIKRSFVEMMKLNGRLLGSFITVMQGYLVIRTFGNEQYESQSFRKCANEAYDNQVRVNMLDSLVRGNNELAGIGMICLSLLLGGYLVINQQTHLWGIPLSDKPMSFGTLTTFYALLVGCSDPIRKLSDIYASLQSGIAGSERVFPILTQEPTIQDSQEPQEINSQNYDLTFEEVDFRYDPTTPVLHRINLTIKHGEKIAIVGPNGCGKSTITKLAMRFFDTNDGVVKLGGINVRDLRQHDLRKQFGYVSQDPFLFGRSILDNIRYGDLEATDEQVKHAARLAHVDQFVDTQMPLGYDTLCGDRGEQLSGGQRQRVALARALLRNPKIMILDEATSQIDLESERLIVQSLKSTLVDKTAILITHQTGMLELADRIVVMNEGQIEAVGTHKELLENSRTYQRLFQNEFNENSAA